MDLKTLQNRITKLNLNLLLKKIFNNREVKDFVIERNQEQLYYRGIDAKGNKIKTYHANSPNVYSNRTISIKSSKGQPTGVVTLKDTGEFYKTFKETGQNEYAEITANFEVHGESISENVDTENILGLIQENKNVLIEFIKPMFVKNFREALLK